ncbi:unnamed protein product [Spodoptera littoralis]|uniref:Uncharacterized protein n=1 Tax=Spodoptera littoralis TaxID=7109 RepID=A0A9P0N1V0_SPOLI|nr:unnamed protein product [Spodoptera littoralis]CAH1641532.1 unnamed protein product [Spodoptera littoralis]
MRSWWFISMISCLLELCFGLHYLERYHYPGGYTTYPPDYVNNTNTKVPRHVYTPDFRIEEPSFIPYHHYQPGFAKERERPLRISPHYKQIREWEGLENAYNLGCYCCTTYRRHTLLAGCAVITTRHVLTTANPTVLILRSYGHMKTLEHILGGWYDTNANVFNSSMFFAPSRIHIHPMYKYDYEMNVSHPIPVMYDLSLWAATHRFYGSTFSYSKAVICPRAASGWYEYASTIPRQHDLSVVVGFQFMKSYHRRPMPWYKYAVRTKSYVWPCPKSDWHWFHCIMGEYWGKFGFDSGGAMHMMMEGKSNRHDGLAGMCSFSLKLRAFQTTHYFTVLDTHPVLDFLYDAFKGLSKYAWLDDRFEDTKYAAPIAWRGEYIPIYYNFGWEAYSVYGNYIYGDVLPNYRR